MMSTTQKILLKTLRVGISGALISGSLALLTYLFWTLVARWYLTLPSPVGGDYYTGLTYATQFAHHLPLPIKGWLSFWNSGVPIIGGYQWLAFYLMAPLFRIFDPVTSLEYFSILTILLFILSSYLVFWQITKNYILALVFTLVVLTSQATYFQLLAGGLIPGSSLQFYLPLSLFFLFRYFESVRRIRSLVIAAIICATALVHHAVLGLLFVIIPTASMLLTHLLFYVSSRQRQLFNFGVFVFFVCTIGALGLFPMIAQMSFGEIASSCNNPQCWGIYPYHISLWLGWLPLGITIVALILFMAFAIIRNIFHKHTNFRPLLPVTAGLLIIIFYPLAAYFHLIDHLSNSIFPRRMFWAVLIMLLAFAAHIFSIVVKTHKLVGWFGGLVVAVSILIFIPLRFAWPFQMAFANPLITDVPNADPNYAYKWLIPKYADPAYANNKLPDWLTPDMPLYRLDSPNVLITHWWNLESKIPVTRGYTSSFNRSQSDWAYFLQTSLSAEANQTTPNKLLENRALFLFDAYGIGYTVNNLYHPLLQREDWYEQTGRFSKLQPELTSPIVEATTAPPMLFIGDDAGFATFIRSIALINYNSRHIIPVKGPTSLSSLNQTELAHFPILFLYRFSGDLSKLESYTLNGGRVFIDFGSTYKMPQLEKIKFFPAKTIATQENTSWNAKLNEASEITKDIGPADFGEFRYQGKPWKYFSFTKSGLKPEVTPLLWQNGETTLFTYPLGKGRIVVSGLNLPFHLVESVNEKEADLYHNLFNYLVSGDQHVPIEANVNRTSPESISINGKDFSGIYFKENFHSGWQAFVGDNSIPIYPAGLNFMYVPVPANSSGSLQLKFTGSRTNWILFIITLVSLGLALMIILSPKITTKFIYFMLQPVTRISARFSTRLQADEHQEY